MPCLWNLWGERDIKILDTGLQHDANCTFCQSALELLLKLLNDYMMITKRSDIFKLLFCIIYIYNNLDSPSAVGPKAARGFENNSRTAPEERLQGKVAV